MATGRPGDIDDAVRSLRTELQWLNGLRRDEIDELTDHFQASICDLMTEQEMSARDAAAAARVTLGSVPDLIREMSIVRWGPQPFKRWCGILVSLTIMLSCWTLLQIADGLVQAAWFADLRHAGSSATLVSILVFTFGVTLTLRIAMRFRLYRIAEVSSSAGEGAAPLLYIVALGITLFLCAVLTDYWDWLIVSVNGSAVSQPWHSLAYTLGITVCLPVVPLVAATLMARWHPALKPVE